jgi:membrane protease YdiL (CAAX protease family)
VIDRTKTAGRKENEKVSILVLLPLSFALFIPLFIFKGVSFFDFWWWFTANIFILLGIVIYFDRNFLSLISQDLADGTAFKILKGIGSAGVLYFIFFAGDFFAGKLMPGAMDDISNIYLFKGSASLLRISLLMLLVIGPGEELFWRGFLQRALSKRHGRVTGYLLAAGLYTFVHVPSGNPMLILSAFLCGLFWGWTYMREGSLVLNIVSHVAWDISVFVVFPFRG